MASLQQMPETARRRAGAYRFSNHTPKTDMTPMVDLGFLLITFFVITAAMNKPVITHLNMPHDGPPMPLGMSNALTVLLDENNTVYYYHGDMSEAIASGKISSSDFNVNHGIGQVIREKQQYLDKERSSGEGKEGLMLLIKPTAGANYNELIKILDETLINDVRKYAIVKPEPAELAWLRQKTR